MHVVVVGAGEVGTYLASRLVTEGHTLALVERDPNRGRQAAEQLDVQIVVGSGASPSVMAIAGTAKADVVVAVTDSDEANLIAAANAKQLGSATTVVRLENDDMRSAEASSLRRTLGVDVVIDPDHETAMEIFELLRFPGADEIYRMSDGEVTIIGARLSEGAPMVGRTLSELSVHYGPHWDFLIGSLTRGNQSFIPRQDVSLEAGDHVRFVCNLRGRKQLLHGLGLTSHIPARVMLLGGGHTARILAERLERQGIKPIIIERKQARANDLASKLDRSTILLGEITDADLLASEGVGRADVVVALTGSDDANVLACLYAKAAGAKETVAVVHRLDLLPLVNKVGVDVVVSPRTSIANAVLRLVRGDAVTTFLHGDSEIIEVQVAQGAMADGALIADLPLPDGVLLGAIVREGSAEIARGKTKLRARDRVVAFATPNAAREARRIFQAV